MNETSGLDQYIDLRELSPEYTTIPCMECDEKFYVRNGFAYNHDTWYCDDCLPEELREAVDRVTDNPRR